jgi:RHS repeat-associated protein
MLLCLLVLVGLLALIPSFTSPSAAAPAQSVQIAPIVPSQDDGVPPNTRTRIVFYDGTASFNYQAGEYVTLYTCTDASCTSLAATIVADDAIKLSVAETQQEIELDFYTQDYPPADVTALFGPTSGTRTVHVQLIDLLGPRLGSPRPFVLVTSTTPAPGLILVVEPAPAGTQFNMPALYYRTSKDPVQTYTGNYTYSFADIAIQGRGPSPLFMRSYNSNDTRIGPLGPGWTHSYNIRLRSPGDGTNDVVLTGPQGRSDRYTANPDGSYTPPPAVYTTLVKNANGTYTATHKDQTTWTFHATGHLLRIEDRYGSISLLTYDDYGPSGKLLSVSDPAGRGALTFTYDASGRLQSVSDWLTPARTITFDYDGSGRLSHMTNREGNTTTYSYDGSTQRLTAITDANGHVAVTNTYDSQGRVATQKDARGISTGQQTTFTYTDNGNGTSTTTIAYPATSFEPGWTYREEDTYDAQGRLTKHVSKPTSNSTEWVIEEYTYDANSNLSTSKDGRGNITHLCYDVDYAGATIAGNRGNLTRRIEPAAVPGDPRPVTLLKYDDKDNLVQTVAPKGVNSTANVNCATDLSNINALFATDIVYDPNKVELHATISRYIDPGTGVMTATTKFEYGDAANPGRVTRVIPPKGNTGPIPNYDFATTFSYFSTGSRAGMLERTTDPEGNATTYDYDPVGRQTRMVDPNGNAPGGVPSDHAWEFVYDNEDRLRYAKAPAPTSGGTPLVTESRYDAVGNMTVSIDANGQVTRYFYDERDSLKEVHESPNPWADPNVPPTVRIVTEYAYDHLGNLLRVTRAKGDSTNERVVDYLSDGLDRVRKETQYPNWPNISSTLITEYTYDQNGNLLTQKDPLNQVTNYTYNARNQLTNIGYPGSPNTPNVAYTYDLNGNRFSMVDGTGTTTYSYDEQDRLLTTTSPGDRGPNTVGYRYDLNGNRIRLLYTDGNALLYTFDRADRLVSLRDWLNNVTSYQYYPDSSLKAAQNPNGTVGQYAYDNAQRLVEIWHKLGANTISKHNYIMDSVGNRTRLDEVLPQNGVVKPIDPSRQATTQYSYDRLYRLTSENTQGLAVSYAYDPVGNRLTMVRNGTTTTYAYDRSDRITREGSIQYIVDANGNLRERGKETYTYDQANRLINSQMPQPTQYIYDGDGKRWKTNAGQGPLDVHVYDVNAPLPLLLEDGRRKYVYGVGLAYALEGNGTMEIYHADGLGSTRAVTYRNGNVVQNYRYDAFGVVANRQGSSNQPMQYAGEERDKETGFVYLRARYYDPKIGRFIQRDPLRGILEVPQSLNAYSYALNNPVNHVDRSGKILPLIVAGALVGAGTSVLAYGLVSRLTGQPTSIQGYLGAAAAGAIAGGVGVVAAPIAGALGLGSGALGVGAVNFAAGALGYSAQSLIDPNVGFTPGGLVTSGVFGTVGGAIAAKFWATPGMTNFRQVGFPRTWGGVLPWNIRANALRSIYIGSGVSAGVGAAQQLGSFLVGQLLELFHYNGALRMKK